MPVLTGWPKPSKTLVWKKLTGYCIRTYHRDQCLGSADLKNSGAKIAIGKTEEIILQPLVTHRTPDHPADRYLLSDELSDFGRRMEPFQKPGVDRGLIGGG